MKSAIVFYSLSGNTRKVASILKEVLGAKGEADLIELKALDESNNFLGQCKRGVSHTRAKLEEVNFDLSQYERVCFGTAVWAFGPTPAMNAYLDACRGLSGKSVILFTTYGSGSGNERCLKYMEQLLSGKGVKEFQRFSVPQTKISQKDRVLSIINKLPL